ncbi:MAG: hypothetical protein FWG43_02310 [Clostridiales bacterium]|nr:hypothetical protein [Clostridiales bacterium]
MEKKLLASIFITLFLIHLSACGVNTRGPLPYGKWESKEPHIIIDINPINEYANGYYEFSGIYDHNNEVIDVFIAFSHISKEFSLFNISDKNNDQPGFYQLALLRGTYSLRNIKLYYRIKPHWKEKSGIKHTIVFELIEEYEVPDKENE